MFCGGGGAMEGAKASGLFKEKISQPSIPPANKIITLSRSGSAELQSLSCPALTLIQGSVNDDSILDHVISVANELGGIDSLILNAGTLDPLGQTSSFSTPAALAAYKSLFDTNYFSLISLIAKSLPSLRSLPVLDSSSSDSNSATNKSESKSSGIHGRIVLVSSGAATKGVAGWGAYSASKAAMNSLARTLGSEESSIMTIAVRPGVVDTAMQTEIRETGASHMAPTDHETFSNLLPEGKLLSPDLPARVLAELAARGRKELSGSFVSWDDAGLLE